MAIPAPTNPPAHERKMITFLKTLEPKLLEKGMTFSSIVNLFAKADDKSLAKEHLILKAASDGNATSNAFIGCSKVSAMTVGKLDATPATVSIAVGANQQITVAGNNAPVTYESSNPQVARVQPDGLIVSVAAGTATIRVIEKESADFFGQEDTIAVTVTTS